MVDVERVIGARGREGYIRYILDQILKENVGSDRGHAYLNRLTGLAYNYAWLSEADEAMQALEELYRTQIFHAGKLVDLAAGSYFDAIRGNARFKCLAAALKLPREATH